MCCRVWLLLLWLCVLLIVLKWFRFSSSIENGVWVLLVSLIFWCSMVGRKCWLSRLVNVLLFVFSLLMCLKSMFISVCMCVSCLWMFCRVVKCVFMLVCVWVVCNCVFIVVIRVLICVVLLFLLKLGMFLWVNYRLNLECVRLMVLVLLVWLVIV